MEVRHGWIRRGLAGLDRLRGRLRTTPDRLTALRVAMVPVLWVVAAAEQTVILGIGVLLASLTDVLDGYLARRNGQTSEFGGHLDSIADHLLTLSTVCWLLWLRPDFFLSELPALAAWGALALLALGVSWRHRRQLGNFHLYSAKAAGALGYLFAVWLLLFGSYAPSAFYVVLGIASVAALELLVASLLYPEGRSLRGTVLLPRREETDSAASPGVRAAHEPKSPDYPSEISEPPPMS